MDKGRRDISCEEIQWKTESRHFELGISKFKDQMFISNTSNYQADKMYSKSYEMCLMIFRLPGNSFISVISE